MKFGNYVFDPIFRYAKARADESLFTAKLLDPLRAKTREGVPHSKRRAPNAGRVFIGYLAKFLSDHAPQLSLVQPVEIGEILSGEPMRENVGRDTRIATPIRAKSCVDDATRFIDL